MVQRKKSGFTLVEAVISLSILAMFFAIVFPFFNSNINALNEVQMRQNLQNQGKKALEKMTKEILECSGVESVTQIVIGSEKDGKSATAITDVKSIVFKTASGYKIFELREDYKLYYGSGTDKVALSATEEIGENIASMKLTPVKLSFVESNGITVLLTLEKATPGMSDKKITGTIESQIHFRNME